MNEKIKLLGWFDYCCSTGFGTVASNIMRQLHSTGKYDIDIIGINYDGDPYDPDKWPGNVWTAISALKMDGPYRDLFGRQKVIDILSQGDYDIFFMIQDTFIVKEIMDAILAIQKKKKVKTIFYYPIDAPPKAEWILGSVSKINFPVAYTQYGYNETIKIDPSLKDNLKVIYHGHNFNEIYPIEDIKSVREFRRGAFLNRANGKFLISNINRNQTRKDISRSFMILNELKKRNQNVILYLHMYHADVGGNLEDIAKNFPLLKKDRDYMWPGFLDVNKGVPVEVINYIYNASDAILTTTHGEGHGLSISEAMATKTPVIAPNNTAITELLADDRGYIIKSGADPSMWIMKDHDNERMRPLMDVTEAANKIEDLIAGKKPDIEGAYSWMLNLSWENICQQWQDLIDNAATS